jgi:hypothetical protein
MQFKNQINRLAETFGANVYKPERIKMIWNDVKDLSPEWFARVVDELIGSSRQPPLVPEFREAVSRERERLWAIEKKQHANEATKFFHSKFSTEDKRWAVQQILRRVVGNMTDHDFGLFLGGLADGADDAQPVDCGLCEDTGLLWARSKSDNHDHVFKCPCRAGVKDGRRYPVWTDAYRHEFNLGLFTQPKQIEEKSK